ncbi:uncharacterized protein At4g22758-like [Phalaenopsis equestris]|uniref:uncharacterized protein At4g22758-like n=1 Tax=Phalaenopsis equestris TaxID=78828 RepID=UPI0009E2821E|nr:uncharacterized protein At4g22758-like [Phalaenopsis equestris]
MALPRNVVEKDKKQRKKNNGKKGDSNRILITVNVIGSAGPIRFVVKEEELVSSVIGTALKTYAREGRRPVLGSEIDCFVLYHAYDGTRALSPWEPIGSFGSRNFLLCKKQMLASDSSSTPEGEIGKKGTGGWKAWFNKSLGLISSN